MNSEYNLHTHTIHSDGGDSVPQVVDGLRHHGVRVFSITDHDTLVGNAEASMLARMYGMGYVTGIELTCCFEGEIPGFDNSFCAHILGLGFDLDKMNMRLERFRQQKYRKIQSYITLLRRTGFRIFSGAGDDQRVALDMPAVVDQLILNGYASSVSDAYERIIFNQRYVRQMPSPPSIREGIAMIHESGGVAVWAHPFDVARQGKRKLSLEQVVMMSLPLEQYGIDAVECYYAKYDTETIRGLCAMADDMRVARSIGTDYHTFGEDSFVFGNPDVVPSCTVMDKIVSRQQTRPLG